MFILFQKFSRPTFIPYPTIPDSRVIDSIINMGCHYSRQASAHGTLSRDLFTMTLTKHITKEKSQRLFLLDSLFLSQGLGFIQRTPAPSQQASHLNVYPRPAWHHRRTEEGWITYFKEKILTFYDFGILWTKIIEKLEKRNTLYLCAKLKNASWIWSIWNSLYIKIRQTTIYYAGLLGQ